jgi:3-hydroxyisobutyrate dehydrogenase
LDVAGKISNKISDVAIVSFRGSIFMAEDGEEKGVSGLGFSASKSGMLSVAVIGLGDLGGAMAARLQAHRFRLTVFDVRKEAMAAFPAAAAASSVREAAANAQALVVVVVSDAQLEAVVSEALSASPRPRLIIVHSTVHPRTVQAVGARAADEGVPLLDAPVTGGRAAVEHGVLTVLAAGSAEAFEAASPVLSAYCARIENAGDLGAGQVAKIANNAMSIINTMLAIEVMRMVEGLGMDSELVRRAIVAGGTGSSRALAGTDDSGFGTSWQKRRASLDPSASRDRPPTVGIKDIGHALVLAKQAGVETPLIAGGLVQLEALARKVQNTSNP